MQPLNILVTCSGEKREYNLDEDTTIQILKFLLEDDFNIPVICQKLIFKRLLDNSQLTLKNYDIKNHSKLMLVGTKVSNILAQKFKPKGKIDDWNTHAKHAKIVNLGPVKKDYTNNETNIIENCRDYTGNDVKMVFKNNFFNIISTTKTTIYYSEIKQIYSQKIPLHNDKFSIVGFYLEDDTKIYIYLL